MPAGLNVAFRTLVHELCDAAQPNTQGMTYALSLWEDIPDRWRNGLPFAGVKVDEWWR